MGRHVRAETKGITWGYPPIAAPESVDLLIVTHEHSDHNGVEVIGGEPTLVRSQPGTHSSPLGDVVAIASEHDDAAGTERGPQHDRRLHPRRCHRGDGREGSRPVLGGADAVFLRGSPSVGFVAFHDGSVGARDALSTLTTPGCGQSTQH
ncbi:MAG: hypothetical protein JST53_04830 [Actinobacteria bacterium]|nr:hypothetical protein [Actinomycetota bacterium]